MVRSRTRATEADGTPVRSSTVLTGASMRARRDEERGERAEEEQGAADTRSMRGARGLVSHSAGLLSAAQAQSLWIVERLGAHGCPGHRGPDVDLQTGGVAG